MQPHDKELSELFDRLDIDEAKRQEILGDVTQGDELLRRQVDPDLPKQLLERIEQVLLSDPVTAAADRDHRRFMPRSWLRPVAAVIAAGFLITAVVMPDKNPRQPAPDQPAVPVTSSNGQMDLLYDEFGLWITASTLEDEMDELALSDILVLWDAAGWEIENILGKEKNHESAPDLSRRRGGAFVV